MRRPLEAALDSLLSKAIEVTDPAEQILESIKFVGDVERKEGRKVTLAHGYQVDKVERALVKGGFPQRYARRLATIKYNHEQPDQPALESAAFIKAGADTLSAEFAFNFGDLSQAADGTTAKRIAGVMEGWKGAFAKKSEDVLKVMNRKGWKNGMVRCEVVTPQNFQLGFDGEQTYACDPGCALGSSASPATHGAMALST